MTTQTDPPSMYEEYNLKQGFIPLLVKDYFAWRKAISGPFGGRWVCFKYAWHSTHRKRDVERSWRK